MGLHTWVCIRCGDCRFNRKRTIRELVMKKETKLVVSVLALIGSLLFFGPVGFLFTAIIILVIVA